MKICQICAVDFTLYHFLLPLMRGLTAEGHEVVGVCTDGPLVAWVRESGFRVETLAVSRNYNLLHHVRAYARLLALFRRERFDLVHVHTPVAALIGRLAAARARVPRIVYTAHGFYFHAAMGWPRRTVFIALEWLAGRITDVLLTQAEEDARTARRLHLCRGGVVEAIGNGSDPARFHPVPADDAARARLRSELGVAPEMVVVVISGRLVIEKGYRELFEAMRRVDAALWVIGERLASDHAAPIDDAVVGVRRDPVLSERIRFLGYRDDVPELLRAADVFTLPSYREGMPRSIIEAMLTGLPVVATDIRGSREEVVEGETGFLVPARDVGALAAALDRLVADAPLRARLGAAGRRRAVEFYDEAKVVARQIEVLGLSSAPSSA